MAEGCIIRSRLLGYRAKTHNITNAMVIHTYEPGPRSRMSITQSYVTRYFNPLHPLRPIIARFYKMSTCRFLDDIVRHGLLKIEPPYDDTCPICRMPYIVDEIQELINMDRSLARAYAATISESFDT